jgi:DNA repair exonuclease SbcCD nuclease subunit
MKIVHTSDLHLDSPLTTRLDSKKVRERKAELILSFKKMTERAAELGAEGFIIAGDLFDSEKVGIRTQKNILSIISASEQIEFFYLSGNHEREVLCASGLPLPKNLKIFDKDWTYFKLADVNIIGKSDTDADMFNSLKLSPEEKNIVVLHGELRDRSGEGGIIGRADIEELPIDYLALGHYHSYSQEQISRRCTAVYSGTPEGRGFDETGDCGFVLIDTDGAAVSHKFIKSALRTLKIIECDVTDTESDVDLLYKAQRLLAECKRSDIIRIRLTGTRELTRSLATDQLSSRLCSSYYYLEVKDDTRVRIIPDDFKNDLSLKGEFIRTVIEDTTLCDKEKERVIAIGLAVLIGEEDI